LKASTFCSDKRFREYIELSKRTGKLVGPGTYNENLARLTFFKKPCPTNYKNPSRINPDNSYNYIMVGNQTLYEPGFKRKKLKKSYLYSSNISVDIKSFVDSKKRNEIEKIRELGDENFSKSLNNTFTRYSSSGIYGCSNSEKKATENYHLFPSRYKSKDSEILRNENLILGNNLKNINHIQKVEPKYLPDSINLSIKRDKHAKILKGIYASNKN